MQTYIIQIGNTDDKLSQKKWFEFVSATKIMIMNFSNQIFFYGHSEPLATWQNSCWVFEMSNGKYSGLIKELEFLRTEYNQDSIALTVGTTLFI